MLKLKNLKSSDVFFTSDLHFGHKNIIQYCNRPFKNTTEMDNTIIENWNKTIPKDGIVFNLGDLGMNLNSYKNLLHKLNGKIYHIIGNHDNSETINYLKSIGIQCYDMAEINISDNEIEGQQTIVLCHYQFNQWNHSHRGSWHLYGHDHVLIHKNKNASLNIGIDGHNMTPWSYQEVKIQITKQLLYAKVENNVL